MAKYRVSKGGSVYRTKVGSGIKSRKKTFRTKKAAKAFARKRR